MLRTSLLLLVCLAPLAFGAMPVWVWAVLACWSGVLLVGVGWRQAHEPQRGGSPFFAVAVLCLLLVLAYAFVQAVPGLPGAHPLWAQAADALGEELDGAISMDPRRTLAGAVKLALPLTVLLLAHALAGPADQRERALAVFVAAATGYAVYALWMQAGGGQQVLWVAKAAYRDVATGTFINRNAFAAYLGLALVATAAVLLARLRDEGLVILVGGAWPWTAGFLLLATALVATQSRGGLASVALALAALLWLRPLTEPRWLSFALRLSASGGLAFGALHLAAERWEALAAESVERLAVYRATVEAILERPLLGHGLGSFPEAFARHRPESVERVFDQAHNGPLHAALELGIPAASLLLLGLILLVATAWRPARRGDVPAQAALAAAVMLAAHTMVDFAPQVPAVAISAAFLMGLAAAAAPEARQPPG